MPNLKNLRIDIDGKTPDLNIATLLYMNPALTTLQLRLVGKGLGKAGGGKGEALRHELQDTLPPRLKEIILEGSKIENIHPAAFKVTTITEKEDNDGNPSFSLQHLQSRTLAITVKVTEDFHLDRDLFLNLGRVQNFSFDFINPTASDLTQKLDNPVTTYSPDHPRAVFLKRLKIGDATWDCSCDGIG